ncbi:MAG TPA: hypothetical protein VEY50_09010 [Lysobacter sp.]|nr:hypothetical protein [Lysobacter sp.]
MDRLSSIELQALEAAVRPLRCRLVRHDAAAHHVDILEADADRVILPVALPVGADCARFEQCLLDLRLNLLSRGRRLSPWVLPPECRVAGGCRRPPVDGNPDA